MKNTEELLRLARGLESMVPDAGLDMENWVSYRSRSPDQPQCGYVACAIGWHFIFNPDSNLTMYDKASCIPRLRDKDLINWGAVRTHFGLTEHEATFLFDSNAYIGAPKPNTVARRIRRFIQRKREAGEVCE